MYKEQYNEVHHVPITQPQQLSHCFANRIKSMFLLYHIFSSTNTSLCTSNKTSYYLSHLTPCTSNKTSHIIIPYHHLRSTPNSDFSNCLKSVYYDPNKIHTLIVLGW